MRGIFISYTQTRQHLADRQALAPPSWHSAADKNMEHIDFVVGCMSVFLHFALFSNFFGVSVLQWFGSSIIRVQMIENKNRDVMNVLRNW